MLLTLAERLTRRRLNALGITSGQQTTAVGDLHFYHTRGVDREADPARSQLPPLVILHGFGASATSFARVLAYLHTRVGPLLAPDAPAHGFSSSRDPRPTVDLAYAGIAELLLRRLDRPAILFGNSLGGAFAIRFALEHPERVRGLFLSSPAGAALDAQDFATLRGHFRVASLGHARRLVDSLTHLPAWYNSLLAPDLLWRFGRGPLRAVLESFQPAHMFTTEQLADLRVPIVVQWGRSERVLPPASLEFFRRALPSHAVFEEPDDFGHCPYMDRPRELAARVAEYVRELAPDLSHGTAPVRRA
jgi:pimeloyl-ACP methyl ester carboxylesterase